MLREFGLGGGRSIDAYVHISSWIFSSVCAKLTHTDGWKMAEGIIDGQGISSNNCSQVLSTHMHFSFLNSICFLSVDLFFISLSLSLSLSLSFSLSISLSQSGYYDMNSILMRVTFYSRAEESLRLLRINQFSIECITNIKPNSNL